MSRASYARVQATVGVATVSIWDFGVAYTRGGGVDCSVVQVLQGSEHCKDPGEDDQVEIVCAKPARGVWGLGGKLYFTKNIVDDSFVPKDRKPKPVPRPAVKPAPKPAPKGKHVPFFYDEVEGWTGLLFHGT